MLYIKHVGNIWFIFECDVIFQEQWSSWFYIILYKYYLRIEEFANISPWDFIIWLRFELEEVAKSNEWFCFEILYFGSTLQLQYHRPPYLPHFREKNKIWGFNCNPENERVPTMMGSPFYRSFNSLPPMATTSNSLDLSRRCYSSSD